jgi:hypothetical protein
MRAVEGTVVRILAIFAAAAIAACSTPQGRYKSAKADYVECVKAFGEEDACEPERVVYEIEAREQDRAAMREARNQPND